ncbi:MAG: hypothetical protein H6581_15460 [Bacteroidia bacterium]|nr:hypothetical protein [Bacteroidia bacterium]
MAKQMMVWLLIKVPWYFLRAMWAFLLGLGKGKGQTWYAGEFLVARDDFRLSAPEKESRLVGLKIYVRTLRAIFKNSKPSLEKLADASVGIYDSRMANLKLRTEYVEAQSGEKVGTFISSSGLLYGEGFLQKILLFCMLSGFFSFLWPFTILSKYRANLAQIMPDTVRVINLLRILRKHKISRLYYFFIFEIYANVAAQVLMSEGITLLKVTSMSPLTFHARVVIASELCVNTAYQMEETRIFKDTLFVGKFHLWAPEMYMDHIEKYREADPEATPKHVLGYYSSGYELRFSLGESHTGFFGDPESDDMLREYLREYLLSHPEVKLKIFLHPFEKRSDERYAQATKYYFDHFQGCNIEIMGRDISTVGSLELVDVALSVLSNSLADRLYFGYKGLFTPFTVDRLPAPGTSLEAICAKSKAHLFELLDRSMAQSTDEFFRENKIDNYRFRRNKT